MESAIGKAIRLRSVLLVAVSAFAAFGKHGRIRFFFLRVLLTLDLAIDRGLNSGIELLIMNDDVNLLIKFQHEDRRKIQVSVSF